jgi:hypothetical protein
MRKHIYLLIILFGLLQYRAEAQVTEQAFVPVIVDVSQILRMNIVSGGNIEFVFNSIEDYRNGISGVAGSSTYITQFNIASSTPWTLNFGTEDGNLLGNDNPMNLLPINYVGFELQSVGNYNLGAEILSPPTADGADITPLEIFPTPLMLPAGGPLPQNAGNALDNNFIIIWRCGTNDLPIMSNLLELEPSPAADRYVANVFFELVATP